MGFILYVNTLYFVYPYKIKTYYLFFIKLKYLADLYIYMLIMLKILLKFKNNNFQNIIIEIII